MKDFDGFTMQVREDVSKPDSAKTQSMTCSRISAAIRSSVNGDPSISSSCCADTTTVWSWGDDLEPDGRHMANVFQGTFPTHDTAADGWAGTCPVDSFEPNGFGMFNMVGNVWEWTSDHFVSPADPSGDRWVIKGGSYLCHASYCRRYRPGARTGSTSDSSTGNTGFRCVKDVS